MYQSDEDAIRKIIQEELEKTNKKLDELEKVLHWVAIECGVEFPIK